MCLSRPAVRTSLVACLLAAAPGCSVALGGEEAQCETDADCEARGGDFAGSICVEGLCEEEPEPVDPKWGCIGKVEPPVAGQMVTLTSRFLDLVTNKAPVGATFRLCNKFDTLCDAPIGEPEMNADGDVTVTIPTDLEAYLEMQAPDYYPMLSFLDPEPQLFEQNPVVFAVPTAVAASLAMFAGVELDETRGILLARMVDCTLAPTAGASVALFPSDGATRFYTINNTVKADASKTDTSGNSGFINVEPGTPSVTGYVAPGGQAYGTVSTLVRAGHISAQLLKPTPTL